MTEWQDTDEVTTTFGTIQQVKQEQFTAGWQEATDTILNLLEDLTDEHALPKSRNCCQYCLTWLVIMEDILKVNNE